MANLLEKQPHLDTERASPPNQPDPENGTIVPLPPLSRILYHLQSLENWINRKCGGEQLFETRGVDRIPEEEKHPPSLWNAVTMWPSFLLNTGSLPLGFVAAEYGLSLKSAFSAATVGLCIGALLPAYAGTLGPRLGLRQIAAARYSFGYWGAKLCAVLNIVISGGYWVINTVVAGQMLSAVSDYHMSTAVGCVVVMVLSYVCSSFGYRLILRLERYFWVLGLALFIALYAQAGPFVSDVPDKEAGLALAGSWLTFMTIQFSNAAGWCCFVSDLYCNYRGDTGMLLIFTVTWIGIFCSTLLSVFLGIILGHISVLNPEPRFADAYTAHGLGGLLHVVWHPTAWAKAALVLCTFTVVGGNISSSYSSGLALQLLGRFFERVPRFIWSFIVSVVVVLLAMFGREHLSAVIENFLSLIAYWVVSFGLVLIIEDVVFRRQRQYDLEAWNDRRRLPLGIAAVVTVLTAYLAGGIMGTAQAWFVGPIAERFGPKGGDVGIFMTAAITVVLYPAMRYLERRYSKR